MTRIEDYSYEAMRLMLHEQMLNRYPVMRDNLKGARGKKQ